MKSCSISQTPYERSPPQKSLCAPNVASGGLTRTAPQREEKLSGERESEREEKSEKKVQREENRYGDSITGKMCHLREFVLDLAIK